MVTKGQRFFAPFSTPPIVSSVRELLAEMYPIVNPYRDKERLANAEGVFAGKSKKGSAHVSSRVLLIMVLLVITGGMYYMHHVHNAHLLVSDKRTIRGSGVSFSDSVKDPAEERKNELGEPTQQGGAPAPLVDLRKKEDPSVLRTGKINTFNPTVVPVDAPLSPELVYKLRAQSADAGAIEDKVIALAAITRNNEAMIAQKRAEVEAARLAAEQHAILLAEQEAIRQAQHLAEEAQQAADDARAAKLIEDRRAAQVAADEQAARINADRLAAQQEADALLAKRADEQRQATIRAQEEEALRAAEAAAAADHAVQQEQQPPPVPVLPQDGPIGVLAPPADPVVDAPAEPARDVAPVGNVDPEPEHTVEEAAAQVAAAMAAEMNQGHPNVPPEEDHHEMTLPDTPVVPSIPVIPAIPEAATAQVPDLAVPDLPNPVEALSPPVQAVLPAEPVIPTEPAQPIPLAPPQGAQGVDVYPGAVEPVQPERPMGFDLPPDKILRMAPEPVEVVPTGEKIDYCAGSVDPFAAQPVESFEPPKGADFELVMQWRSAVSALLKKISKVTFGGEALRELIRSEVEPLKVMRFKMFCKYA